MSITYKGNNLVENKHFVYENDIIQYRGKIYGDRFLFGNEHTEYILDESDLQDLQQSRVSDIVKEEDENNNIKEKIQEYIKEALDYINSYQIGKNSDLNNLINIYKSIMNYMKDNNKNISIGTKLDTISIEAQKSYLKELYRNRTEINFNNLYNTLNNFIYSLNKLLEGGN